MFSWFSKIVQSFRDFFGAPKPPMPWTSTPPSTTPTPQPPSNQDDEELWPHWRTTNAPGPNPNPRPQPRPRPHPHPWGHTTAGPNPGPTPGPGTTPAPGPTPNSDAAALLAGYNLERNKYGARPLSINSQLQQSAQGLADYMAQTGMLSHMGPGGNSMGDRMRAAGYVWTSAGENIADGYRDPTSVVAGWVASAGHHQNMINPSFMDVGFGKATSTSGVIFWVCDLGKRGMGTSMDCDNAAVFCAGPHSGYYKRNPNSW